MNERQHHEPTTPVDTLPEPPAAAPKKPWVTPDVQELEHEMTAGVPGGFGDGYTVGY